MNKFAEIVGYIGLALCAGFVVLTLIAFAMEIHSRRRFRRNQQRLRVPVRRAKVLRFDRHRGAA